MAQKILNKVGNSTNDPIAKFVRQPNKRYYGAVVLAKSNQRIPFRNKTKTEVKKQYPGLVEIS